jgi:hypothetical protein
MRYEITVSFNTSEQLKDEQIDQLLHALRVQIEEPADEYGNDEEYLTSEISLELSAYSCGSCGDNFMATQGTISKDSNTHYSFTCNNCGKVAK